MSTQRSQVSGPKAAAAVSFPGTMAKPARAQAPLEVADQI